MATDMKGLPPRINEANRPWWEGLDREAIVMPRCDDCDRLIFYPRIHCPHCFSRNVSWTEVTEAPILFTWAKAEHSVSPAYDHLGPVILAIVETQEDDIKVGMTLVPVFDRDSYPGHTLLRFKG